MELLQLPKYRGERISNPFNIDKSKSLWEGKIDGPDKRFESFSSPVYGIRAGVKLLRTYFEKYGLQILEIKHCDYTKVINLKKVTLE